MSHLVVMGVSGSGKTFTGGALAGLLEVKFLDADDFHPLENKIKMAAGTPLNDEDRLPWLARVGSAMSAEPACVMACSALKLSYRNLLRDFAPNAVFIHLNPSKATLLKRLRERQDHFVGPELLESQLMTLEPLTAQESGVLVKGHTAVSKIASMIAELAGK